MTGFSRKVGDSSLKSVFQTRHPVVAETGKNKNRWKGEVDDVSCRTWDV